ncbi:hypothetical protein FRX31_028645 [Thalictrum thalictroides]|uniref:Transmembrane protein n=1 Tax=Thalictrum thalictroides TaxID=46969 RepID=A0A7J6VAF9_THATH|nr:hypothetical protein FRX31_028645 [Thalictrum thalictroides]
MGRSYFLIILIVSTVLSMCFSQGCCRNINTFKDNSVFPREMMELMDYDDPGANTNPRYNFFLTPPSPPSSSPPSLPPQALD